MVLRERAHAAQCSYRRYELGEQQRVNENGGMFALGFSKDAHNRLAAVLLTCAYGVSGAISAMKQLGLSPPGKTSLYDWHDRFVAAGCNFVALLPNAHGSGTHHGEPKLRSRLHIAWILAMRTLHPEAYLREIAAAFHAAWGEPIHPLHSLAHLRALGAVPQDCGTPCSSEVHARQHVLVCKDSAAAEVWL